MRWRRAAGWVGVSLVVLLFALAVAVQAQQWVLRRRAERLHAEIVALQLHPGTFADIQRMQTEWGRFGKYYGECTPQHCVFHIVLTSFIDDLASRHDLYWGAGLPWPWLGDRDAFLDANVRVNNDRMWGEDYKLQVGEMFVHVMGGSHLFRPGEGFRANALQRHYRDGFEGACTGCIGANIYVTPETSASDIRWLNEVNFSCITRWRPCENEDDLIPGPWSRREQSIDFTSPLVYFLGDIAVEVLGQEAPQAVLVEIVSLKPHAGDPDASDAEVRVLEPLKNAKSARTGSVMSIQIYREFVRPEVHTPQQVASGQRYILAYYYDPNLYIPGIEVKAIIQATPQNLHLFRAGVSRDASVGESYNGWQAHMDFP